MTDNTSTQSITPKPNTASDPQPTTVYVVTDDAGEGDHGILFAGPEPTLAFETAQERAACDFGEVEIETWEDGRCVRWVRHTAGDDIWHWGGPEPFGRFYQTR